MRPCWRPHCCSLPYVGKKTKDARLAMNKASGACKQQNQSEYVEKQILQASIQKYRKGRIAPALSAFGK
jgi:hypothetical protein